MFTKKSAFMFISVILLVFNSLAQAQNLPIKNKIVAHHYKSVHQNPNWEIDAAYPNIILANKKTAEDFNRLAKTKIMTYVNTFKKMFTQDDNPDFTYDMSISYTVELLTNDLVSLLFQGREFTGGAHGNAWSFTLNYDLKNNKKLELVDLFKRNSNFLSILSKESIRQILEQQGGEAGHEWVEGGASKHIENFKSWNMTPKGLKITFDPYQVASYAEGIFTTAIPYKAFSSILKKPFFILFHQ